MNNLDKKYTWEISGWRLWVLVFVFAFLSGYGFICLVESL